MLKALDATKMALRSHELLPMMTDSLNNHQHSGPETQALVSASCRRVCHEVILVSISRQEVLEKVGKHIMRRRFGRQPHAEPSQDRRACHVYAEVASCVSLRQIATSRTVGKGSRALQHIHVFMSLEDVFTKAMPLDPLIIYRP